MIIHADYMEVAHHRDGYTITIDHGDRRNVYINPRSESLKRLTDFMESHHHNFLFTTYSILMWWFASDSSEFEQFNQEAENDMEVD